MPAQLRIYTINKGEMDAFLKHFKEEVAATHEKIGYPILSTYVNRPQNEFVWIRGYKDEADRDAKNKAFQEACAAAGIKLGANVAKMEIRELTEAF
ncbi:MAG TPA: NIPSNAP family protein [Chloroflexota bacterium]|nr:NIPSNAP family protein [Chloroflexota bacterium]